MAIQEYRRPLTFYTFATIIPWGFWFASAYVSHMPSSSPHWIAILGLIGLCAPAMIALTMIGVNKNLRTDLLSRIFNFNQIKPIYLFLTFFLMLMSILLAQTISLLFGYSGDQFIIRVHSSFSGGNIPGWFWLFFAPFVEELAWHSYGTDCLRQRMSLLYTSLLFAVYWAFWHYPLFFIKGYYHSNLEQTGFIYSLNFMVSIIPFVIIMNWLYYKSHRNLLVVIIFHITAGFFNEIFNTSPDSKIIQNVLLAILALFLIFKDKHFFLQKEYSES